MGSSSVEAETGRNSCPPGMNQEAETAGQNQGQS